MNNRNMKINIKNKNTTIRLNVWTNKCHHASMMLIKLASHVSLFYLHSSVFKAFVVNNNVAGVNKRMRLQTLTPKSPRLIHNCCV